jgi:hypothetical protein
MKTTYLSFITLLCCLSSALADHPYFPFSKERKVTYLYAKGLAGGNIVESVANNTGETKEQDGKKYFITKNWMLNEKNEKIYPTDSLTRIDKEGNLYMINTGVKTEMMALPAASKLKKDFAWTVEVMGMEVKNKVVSVDGKVNNKDFKMDDLLVIEQKMNEDTTMRSYFKKEIGVVAVATINKEGVEELMFHIKQK